MKRFDKLRTRDHLAVNYIFSYISSSSSFSSTLAVISPILFFSPFLPSSSAIPLRLYFTCRYSQVNHSISIHICTYKYIYIYMYIYTSASDWLCLIEKGNPAIHFSSLRGFRERFSARSTSTTDATGVPHHRGYE